MTVDYVKNDERSRCPVEGKMCLSQKEANNLITRVKRYKGKHRSKIIPQRAYFCKYCHSWHLTHYRRYETCKVTLRRYGARSSSRFEEG